MKKNYANSFSLMKKYRKLVTAFSNIQLGRDYLFEARIQKPPISTHIDLLIPNGYHTIIGMVGKDKFAVQAVFEHSNRFEQKLYKALCFVDRLYNPNYPITEMLEFMFYFLGLSNQMPNWTSKRMFQYCWLQIIKNPTSGGNGRLISTSQASFSAAHSAGSADSNDTNYQLRAHNDSNLQRGTGVEDTSSLTGAATVTSWNYQVYRDDNVVPFANGDSTTLEIVPTNQAAAASIANADFGTYTFTSKGSLACSSTSNAAYNTITGTDNSFISLTGNTKLGLIYGKDLTNTTPSAGNDIGFQNAGASNPAKLTVNYTIGKPGGFFLAAQ